MAVYRYFRSLAVDSPFLTARENLVVAFEKVLPFLMHFIIFGICFTYLKITNHLACENKICGMLCISFGASFMYAL